MSIQEKDWVFCVHPLVLCSHIPVDNLSLCGPEAHIALHLFVWWISNLLGKRPTESQPKEARPSEPLAALMWEMPGLLPGSSLASEGVGNSQHGNPASPRTGPQMVFSDSNITHRWKHWSQGVAWMWHLCSQTKAWILSSNSCAARKISSPSGLGFLVTWIEIVSRSWGLEMVQGWKKSFFINHFRFYSLTVLHMTIIYPHYSLLSSPTPTKAFILPNKSPFTFIPLHMYMCVHVQMCACVYVWMCVYPIQFNKGFSLY